MNGNKCSATNHWQSMLKMKGGSISEEAKKELLEDSTLEAMREPLEFISKNWADPLRPALMALACESVGGNAQETTKTATALALMNLSFYLWDDVIDEAKYRMFKPTFVGKYDTNMALIIGGLASAKAFTILNQQKLDENRQSAIATEIWKLWAGMATAETKSLHARKTQYHARDKLLKIKSECETNLATCLRIGAILGSGSESEITHLGNYGKYLGVIIDLRNDIRTTVNLTLELDQKIATGALPYALLWAKEHSKVTAGLLSGLTEKKHADPEDIQAIVTSVMSTNSVKRIQSLTYRLTKKAAAELAELRQNNAIQTLRIFVEAQLQMLAESIIPSDRGWVFVRSD